MSQKDQVFDEFMEEAEKDQRQEKWLNLWKKYGKFFSVGIIAIFGATMAQVMWKSYKEKQNEEAALKFLMAQNYMEGDEKSKEKGDAVLASLSSGSFYDTLGHFLRASYLSKSLKKEAGEEAIRIYDSVLNDKGLSPSWKDLALIYKVQLLLNKEPLEATDLQDFATRIEPLTHEKKPWRFAALELYGFLLYKLEKFDEASTCFITIAQSEDVLEGAKARARLFSQVIVRQIFQGKGMKDEGSKAEGSKDKEQKEEKS